MIDTTDKIDRKCTNALKTLHCISDLRKTGFTHIQTREGGINFDIRIIEDELQSILDFAGYDLVQVGKFFDGGDDDMEFSLPYTRYTYKMVKR
jgi:hypothetical protein